MNNIFGVPGYGLLIHSRRRFGSSHLEPLSAERRSTRSSQRKWLSSPSVSGCLLSRRSGDCQTIKNFPGHMGFLEAIPMDSRLSYFFILGMAAHEGISNFQTHPCHKRLTSGRIRNYSEPQEPKGRSSKKRTSCA